MLQLVFRAIDTEVYKLENDLYLVFFKNALGRNAHIECFTCITYKGSCIVQELDNTNQNLMPYNIITSSGFLKDSDGYFEMFNTEEEAKLYIDSISNKTVDLEIEIEDLKKQVKDLSEYKRTSDNLLNAACFLLKDSMSRGKTASALVETINEFLQ